MKKIVSTLLLALLLCGAVLGLASCGEKEPVGGGAQISVYLGDAIYDFDPQGDYTNDAALSVISLMFEPLFRINSKGELKNAMASDYEVNEKTRTIRIKLRESYWDDGVSRVTASDFIYAWKELIRSQNANPAAVLLYDIENALEIKKGEIGLDEFGARAVNDKTIEIKLEEGCKSYKSFLRNLASLSLSPLNSRKIGKSADFWAKRLTTFSANGPFTLDNYNVEEGTFTLTRNVGYHRPAKSDATADAYVTPYILKTLWNVDPEKTNVAYLDELTAQLTAKTCFYMGELSLAKRAEMKNKIKTSDLLSTYTYAFDTENPLFASKEVRLVLESVIDRSEIVKTIVFGKAATGLVPSKVADGTKISSNFRKNSGNLLSETATKTVEAANAELDSIGAVRGAFTLTYLDSETEKAIAEYVASKWTALGYTVTLNPVSGVQIDFDDDGAIASLYDSALQRAYESGEFDVIGIDYQMFSTDALVALAALTSDMNGNGLNYGSGEGFVEGETTYEPLGNVLGYVNADYDKKVADAFAEKNLDKRADLLHEAEKLLLNDMPIIPLVFNQSYYTSTELSGISFGYNGYVSFTKVSQKNYTKYLPVAAPPATNPPTTTAPEE